jgi:hypothetical protein
VFRLSPLRPREGDPLRHPERSPALPLTRLRQKFFNDLTCTPLRGTLLGFFPIPRLNPKHPSTSFTIRKSPLRIDLLTPRMGSQGEDPVYIPRLKAAAQPLPYLNYLFEDPVRGAVINGEATLVLIPQPIRYALHKLIVSQEREPAMEAKKHKDLWQAFQLLTFFEQERPLDIIPAWIDLISRGPKWHRRAAVGLTMMEGRFGKSALAESLRRIVR